MDVRSGWLQGWDGLSDRFRDGIFVDLVRQLDIDRPWHSGFHLGLADDQDPRAGVVCVGDKAMIQVEEPISYPLNEAWWDGECQARNMRTPTSLGESSERSFQGTAQDQEEECIILHQLSAKFFFSNRFFWNMCVFAGLNLFDTITCNTSMKARAPH